MQTPIPARNKYRLSTDRADQIRIAPPLVLTLREAAAYIACSPRKLRYMLAAGDVKHRRIGNKIVVRREWLDSFLGA